MLFSPQINKYVLAALLKSNNYSIKVSHIKVYVKGFYIFLSIFRKRLRFVNVFTKIVKLIFKNTANF